MEIATLISKMMTTPMDLLGNIFFNPNRHAKTEAGPTAFNSRYYQPKSNKKLAVPHFESASSLQSSIHSVFFDKGIRFQQTKNQSTDKFYDLPNFNQGPKAGMGIGNRKPLFSINSNPSPSQYKYTSIFDENVRNKKGSSLTSKLNVANSQNFPGPGSYNKDPKYKMNHPISFTSRPPSYFDMEMKGKVCISPQHYSIKTDAIENSRFKNISQGIGEKLVTKTNNVPGVGSYNIPSVFDMKRRNKPALN